MKRIVVNDKMQNGYVYFLNENIGENFHEEFNPENAITCDTSSLCPDCYEYYLHRSCDHMHSTENAMKGSFLSSQKSVVKYLKYFRAHFLSDQQQLIYF